MGRLANGTGSILPRNHYPIFRSVLCDRRKQTMVSQLESLRLKADFLASLDRRAADLVLSAARIEQFPPETRILNAGARARNLFMLSSGRARYYKITKSGSEITLHMLAVGDVFGVGTLLKDPAGNYIGSAETLDDCEILIWEHSRIRALATAHPQLAENALRIVLQYLQAYVGRHSNLLHSKADQRLAVTLLDLGHRTGRVMPHGIEIDATNEHLGGLADITHFTASRLLNKWSREGVISKARNKVVIRVPEALSGRLEMKDRLSDCA
jgi:CRP/FNR family transcriptional regulator